MARTIQDDIDAIARIDVVRTILDVVCRTTGMGFAAVARVTDDKWVACAVQDQIAFGLVPGGELELNTTICNEIRQNGKLVVIEDVAQDEAFRDHHTPRLYGFRSYISVPIVAGGEFFGTLCAIDPNPARVKAPEVVGMFTLFADLIAQHLDVDRRLAASEAALMGEREAAELREQFIAVLGHDLRNPLASIQAGTRLLVKTELSDKGLSLVGHMMRSVERMAGLIDDVMDFARGRLGQGFAIERRPDGGLAGALEHAINELRIAYPGRSIVSDIALSDLVSCDTDRISQLLSNLLANALTHGSDREPVRVQARTADGGFELWVANAGEPIPAAAYDRLFQPFARASVHAHHQGLGLGLYIAAEIARAHGGELSVRSDAVETRFTLRMPLS
jgi:signal transduction histidine kinase